MVSTSKPGALQWAKGRSIVSRAGALLGTFALLLTSLVALPTVASAAQANSGITISDIALERVGGGENVTVGDKVKVSGNWDASSAEPVPGDEFFIGLPSEFTFDTAVPFELKGADGEIWAKCVTDPVSDRATCTLTDIVEERPDLVNGTFAFEVTLTETPLNDGSSIAWAAPVWSGTGVEIDGESAIVTIGRDPNATVSLENHAATSTAGISLIKGIAGEAAEAVSVDAQFPVIASWVDAEGEPQTREFMIDSNAPISLGEDLQAGTEVTFTEGERPGIDTVI